MPKPRILWQLKYLNMKLNRLFQTTFFACALCFLAVPAFAAPIAVVNVKKSSNGITLQMNPGVMRLEVFSPRTIRVTYASQNKLPDTASLAVIGKPQHTAWRLTETSDEIILRTDQIEARVGRASGAVSFFDSSGALTLAETPDGGKSLTPNHVGGIDTLRSREEFMLAPDEAIYGLGQHGSGTMNYRGTRVHLQQRNPTESAVPVLVSSRGYGILWDNPAIGDVDVGQADPQILSWESEATGTIDFYFMFGPRLDDVIASYRQLTGAEPMMGRWVWGFWQCKEHYASQEELTNVVAEYRQMHVPLDGIIQDWQYWPADAWGSHQFDPARYPHPAEMVQDLHAMHAHVMISVWAKFDLGTSNYNELQQDGFLYAPTFPGYRWSKPAEFNKYYDPFNPDARRVYWRQISDDLFKLGIDGWWLDASEPELSIHWGEFRTIQTAQGPGVDVFNAYPLMHTTAVYQGQRAETGQKRVCILTRSAWAGQQRNAAITWSGDIYGRWDVFAKQIPAGLNFSISGIPYWNTDIGGFFGANLHDPNYQELFTRWFQFGAFCPMFRVHGTDAPKEIWRWDGPTQEILKKFIDLRYRLLPYTYSTAWLVTSEGYSMMRPLVMDFQSDTNVLNLKDEYMFGPAILVCPVTQSNVATRAVYLPAGTTWYDFWTGNSTSGGQTVEAAAPIEIMPLFVRAGSIIPYGPKIEYAMEASDPIELRVYRGADGRFSLYEDEGDNYNYEKGKFATIPIAWNETTHTLEIGKRQGRFPGMLKEHTFNIVWVAKDHGAGVGSTDKPDAVVHYKGDAVMIPGPEFSAL